MAPLVLSPITKWFIGVGLLVVLYFSITKAYSSYLGWLDEQKEQAVTSALDAQAATVAADSANAQLSNIEQQLEAQKESQAEMLKAFNLARGSMQRIEQRQRDQNLKALLQTDPVRSVSLVNSNTASAWAEFEDVNKELSHEK